MSVVPKLEISHYLSIALRRKWWVIWSFTLCLFLGSAYYLFSQKVYKATTLILLEPQSIPESYVRSTVVETMEGRLRTITQQIHSRTNLEKIIADFRLSQGAGKNGDGPLLWLRETFSSHVPAKKDKEKASERAELMSLVEKLKKGITVSLRTGGGGARDQRTAFEITFEWYDAEVVAPVTNAIAARFIEENLNAREEIAIGTTDFLEKETAVIRTELESREKQLEAFKRENMGMLPDQLQSNLSILNQLRDESLSLERRLDQEKQQLLLVVSQTQAARAERDSLASVGGQEQGRGANTGGDRLVSNAQLVTGSLEELEAEVLRLSTQYTEKHPDVIALKRQIEALRKEGRPSNRSPSPSSAQPSQDPAAAQAAQINARIASLQKEIKEVEKQIMMYKERVENTPNVEMSMSNLMRDYQTVRQRYDTLLARKLDAKMAEELERRRKGEQFRVLDPAVKPTVPIKPNMQKILFMTLVAGLGMGFGLAYLREALAPQFYSPDEVEAFLNAKVLVSLPMADAELRS
jgi:polysaccharide chain length determinant protein (PEP-CTERM system associated)